MRRFQIANAEVGGPDLLIVAGPCVVESEAMCMEVARTLRDACVVRGLPFVFKASYRKANRSSGGSFTGRPMDEALAALARVKRELGVPVLTDVHEVSEVAAARLARETSVPYLGLCLGMQVATIDFARNVVGWADANSSEFDPQSEHKVIDLLADQANVTEKGGTMRLGAYRCALRAGSLAARAYGKSEVEERHRHRYELNNKYAQQLTSRGLVLSGKCMGRELIEIVELPDHPWFLAVQYHPELKSRPQDPHPLFRDFVRAALERRVARVGSDAYDPAVERPAAKAEA